MKFKSKQKAWNGPSKKSNVIYLKNYRKIFKRIKEDDTRRNVSRG
jgi:hypothetical protein